MSEKNKEGFKYGVADLAEQLGIQPASVRVQLRNKGIPKAGKAYGWNTKEELKAVADKVRAGVKEEAEKKTAPAKAKGEKKAAPKATVKKAAA